MNPPAMKWFRLWNSLLNNQKVQTLSDPLFRAYINTLCIASANETRGQLPPLKHYAFALHCTETKALKIRSALVAAQLLEEICANSDEISEEFGGNFVFFRVKNWEKNQYNSDLTTVRTQRHKEKRERSRNVPGTAPETDTDTDTDTERETVSLSASREVFFSITEERWQKAQSIGCNDRKWVEYETAKFLLEHSEHLPSYKDPDKAWLKWLHRGKEYAANHPKVVAFKAQNAPPPRRRHLFGERS